MFECAWVYILSSQRNGTLYIGVTRDIAGRMHAHRRGLVEGFTRRHGVTRLVYLERHDRLAEAIHREKCLKKWRRAWKLDLIERENPRWEDLFDRINM